MIRAAALIWAVSVTPVSGNDALTCKPYAKEAFSSLYFALASQPVQDWISSRLQQICGNAEGHAPLVPDDWQAIMRLVLEQQDNCSRVVDASPRQAPAGGAPPDANFRPVAKTLVKYTPMQQPVCVQAHMKTVWAGKSWRCTR